MKFVSNDNEAVRDQLKDLYRNIEMMKPTDRYLEVFVKQNVIEETHNTLLNWVRQGVIKGFSIIPINAEYMGNANKATDSIDRAYENYTGSKPPIAN